jgi:hypothetical protein
MNPISIGFPYICEWLHDPRRRTQRPPTVPALPGKVLTPVKPDYQLPRINAFPSKKKEYTKKSIDMAGWNLPKRFNSVTKAWLGAAENLILLLSS